MKRKSLFFIAMTVVLATVINLFAGIVAFADGATTPEVVEIDTVDELKAVKDNLAGNYKLTANIDLGGEEWYSIGETNPDATSGFFSGVFDGNGYTISNFKMTTYPASEYPLNWMNRVGFFGIVTGTIKNLTIANARYDVNMTDGTNGSRVGSIAAIAGALYDGGKISGCQTAEDVTITLTQCSYWYQSGGSWKTDNRSYSGGIVGWIKDGTVEYCINRADLTRSHTDNRQYYDGGIAGQIETGSISYCINYGDILTTTKANWNAAGGIVGRMNNEPTVVENCINYGAVKNTGTDDDLNREAGGIVGVNAKAGQTICNNFNLGEIFTEFKAGQTTEGGTEIEIIAPQILGWRNGSNDPATVSGNYGLNTASNNAVAVKFGNARKSAMANSNLQAGITLTTEDEIKANDTYKAIVAEVAEHLTGISTDLYGYQTTAVEGEKFDLRLVATLSGDYTKLANVGFKVEATYTGLDGKKETVETVTKLYKSITATNGQGSETNTEHTAASLGGDYIFVLACKGIPADAENLTFTVTTFYTLNGAADSVYREAKTFEVKSADDTVND